MLERSKGYLPLKIFRNISVQNFFFLAVIQGTNILISIISVPLIIQRVGIDQFGLINLSLSVITSLNIVVSFGYNLSGPRVAAVYQNNRYRLSKHFTSIVYSKIVLALLLTAVIVLITAFTNAFESYNTILLFSTIILFSEATQLVWFFQGIERTRIASVTNVLSKVLYLLAIIFFIDVPANAKYVNFLWGASALLFNIGLVIFALKHFKVYFVKAKITLLFRSIKENINLFFYNLISYITVSGGIIILSFFESSVQLGMYGMVEKVVITLRFLPSLVLSATFPKASHLFIHQRELYYSFLRKISSVAMVLSALVTLTTFFFASEIIHFLSKSYLEDSILYLKIMCIMPFLSSVNIYNMMYFLTRDLQQEMIKSSVINSIYMVLATTLLCYFYGTVGLCIGLVSSEVFTIITCTIVRLRHHKSESEKSIE